MFSDFQRSYSRISKHILLINLNKQNIKVSLFLFQLVPVSRYSVSQNQYFFLTENTSKKSMSVWWF